MAEKLSALDYLAAPQKHPARPVCAVFGNEAFLRRQVILALRTAVLGGEEGEFSLRTFAGRAALLRDVLDELGTVAMFGGNRLVVIEEADDFITRYRQELEDYVAAPAPAASSCWSWSRCRATHGSTRPWPPRGWASIAAHPAAAADEVAGGLGQATAPRRLSHAAAEMLTEMVGSELGLLDQELARLALLAGEGKAITSEMVEQSAGGWRTKTVWDMLDAVLDGNAREAIRQLDRLLAAKEQPVGILRTDFGLVAPVRHGHPAHPASRGRGPPHDRLRRAPAGRRQTVRAEKAERQLRRLGRQRGSLLHGWLLEADQQLKGDSTMPPRLVLERLLVRLAVTGQSVPRGVD